jgi:hypothetical protein
LGGAALAVVLGFALVALAAALATFLTGALFVVFALLPFAAAVRDDFGLALVALRAGAFSAAERFFKGCGFADLPAVARLLAEGMFEL